MMEKDPKQRIQQAGEVSERLAPWAEDSTPMYPVDFDNRQRWTPGPVQEVDDQATDPNLEASGVSSSKGSHSNLQATGGMNDQSTDHSSIYKSSIKPPPPLSTVEQYSSAKRLNDDYQFGMTELVITGLVCLVIGIAAGVLLTFLSA